MMLKSSNSFRCARRADGFALIELLVILAVLSLLIFTHFHRLSGSREQVYIAVDLANVRQILRASALYNLENDDRMAHPTWGSDLTGPDGWAYLTSNRNREVPGALQSTPGSCAGRDVSSSQFTNQLAYFKVGQVTQYLPDVRTAWCPKDVATRGSGKLRQLWLDRPVKVTSYCWNGSIGGYVGPFARDLGGKTHKASAFLPTDWQMWEQNENAGFYFNDAGASPEIFGEFVSSRHSGQPNWYTAIGSVRNLPGGGVVGTFGGSALFVKWQTIFDLAKAKSPNAALNGPGYRNGPP